MNTDQINVAQQLLKLIEQHSAQLGMLLIIGWLGLLMLIKVLEPLVQDDEPAIHIPKGCTPMSNGLLVCDEVKTSD